MADTLLDVRNVTHDFSLSKTACVRALDRLSFSIRRGEIYGLVGESGSGKSTAARCVMNLVQPRAGQIFYQGIDITNPRQFAANKKLLQTSRQMIFQDSTSSLNGRMKVCDIIAEPMRIARMTPKRGTYRKEAAFQMKYVGLDEMYLDKYPAELSGGQRQRVAIWSRSFWWQTSRLAPWMCPFRHRSSTSSAICRRSTAFRFCSSHTIFRWCAICATAWAFCCAGGWSKRRLPRSCSPTRSIRIPGR